MSADEVITFGGSDEVYPACPGWALSGEGWECLFSLIRAVSPKSDQGEVKSPGEQTPRPGPRSHTRDREISSWGDRTWSWVVTPFLRRPIASESKRAAPEERPLVAIRETEIYRLLLPAPRNQAKCAKAGTEEQQGRRLRHLGGVPIDKEEKLLAVVVVSNSPDRDWLPVCAKLPYCTSN